jgi:2-polyprenyl-3-methyl-5-hydroxy-6-metoxy-1,4-benzoquinol methylase
MKNKEKEALVKKLYEKYPYPSRPRKTKKELCNYSNWILKILDKEQEFWKGKEILELGCGTGELANALVLCGARVNAIDFSNSSITKAKTLKQKLKLGKELKFEEKNILSFVSKKRFDVVIALGSLHHTVDARKGFLVAAGQCKTGGLVIVGLYNKYSRFRHRLKRFVLYLLGGKNIEKRISLGKKLFGGNYSKAWLGDKYGQVHESYHSVNEILKWFNEEGIEFVTSKPKFELPIVDELKWLIRKENAFFVMVGKKV